MVNLVKGQKVDLTKAAPGMTEVTIGLGWDVGNGVSIDLDASVALVDENDKGLTLVYFGKQSAPGVKHSGDNLTGEGDGDDEQIFINLPEIQEDVHKLKFIVNIYDAVSRRQNFGQVQNAFIRVVNKVTNEEMLRYDLSEDYSIETGVIIGEMYRHNGEWKFAALGDGFENGLTEICTNLGL